MPNLSQSAAAMQTIEVPESALMADPMHVPVDPSGVHTFVPQVQVDPADSAEYPQATSTLMVTRVDETKQACDQLVSMQSTSEVSTDAEISPSGETPGHLRMKIYRGSFILL